MSAAESGRSMAGTWGGLRWLKLLVASGEAPEWIARQLGHSSTEMLFRVYSRYVPNLTRQDGSAIDRLLATRFATSNASAVTSAVKDCQPSSVAEVQP